MSHLISDIQAAFEQDQRYPKKAVSASDLPLSFESITDEWLTAVLCANIEGAKVTGHQLGPVDTGSSNRRRLQITYNEIGKASGLPKGLFCKASHELANRIVLGVSGGAFTEVHFYNQIRPLLKIEAPKSFHANFDPVSFNSIIMLEDITNNVTEFCSHKTEMTFNRACSQLKLLAELHGNSYSDQLIRSAIQHLPTWPEYFDNTEAFGMKEGSNSGFIAAEEVIPQNLFSRYENIWPCTLKSMEIHSKFPYFLSHGDVHLKNWYVAGNGEMGLSDWQCATRGHWGRDLAYTISTALTVQNRRSWEKDLIKFYIETLKSSGGPAVSFDEAWMVYRQQLITALTWWTITMSPTKDIPDMQPKDITLEFIRRISTAMDDLDTMDVLLDFS